MIAVGFRITVAKWLVLVRLLLGEIPERLEFTTPGLAKALQPYFRLTLAVRGGDLSAFRCAAVVPYFKGQEFVHVPVRLCMCACVRVSVRACVLLNARIVMRQL